MPNNQVYATKTSLNPRSLVESIVHYGDLIWNTCHTQIRRGRGVLKLIYFYHIIKILKFNLPVKKYPVFRSIKGYDEIERQDSYSDYGYKSDSDGKYTN